MPIPEIPAGFVRLEHADARLVVRRGYEGEVETFGVGSSGTLRPVAWVKGGREAHAVVAFRNGERALVRRYRRGGIVRHVNRGTYFFGRRAEHELRVTAHAALGGVRVPAVIAAIEIPGIVGYTATLVTRWISDAADLAEWLAEAAESDRPAVLSEAGRQIAAMHGAGIGHPDLNLRNILVAPARGLSAATPHLIDFDRGRIYPRAAPATRRTRDLLRLARSARKLGAPIDTEGWEALRAGYGSAWPLTRPLG